MDRESPPLSVTGQSSESSDSAAQGRKEKSRWERVKALFLRPGISRLKLGKDGTEEHRETWAQVRRLLAFARDKSTFDLDITERDDASREPSSPSQNAIFSCGSVVADRFRIKALIGQGGMGQVYEATDLISGSLVAVKVLRPDLPLDLQSTELIMRQEAQLTRRVTHPNICRVNDLYVHHANGIQMLIVSMELLGGRNLAEVMAARGRFPVQAAFGIAEQLAGAIDAAHAAGIVHRDMKPSNVMLCGDDEAPRVVITDFGVARLAIPGYSKATESSSMAGTLRYMAPEQLQGRTGFRSDLYSLCLILYELVTGQLPFSGPNELSIAFKRLSTPPRDPASIVSALPPQWRAALLKGLSRDPRDRFSSGRELVESLSNQNPFRRMWLLIGLRATALFRLRRAWAVAAAAVFSALIWLYKPTDRHSAVPFSQLLYVRLTHDASTDPVLTGADANLLAALQQSAQLSTIPLDDLSATIKRLGKTSSRNLDREFIRQIALRNGRTAVLSGSISKAGNYRIRLSLEELGSDPRRPRMTLTHDFEARAPQDVFRALERAALWVRKAAGEGDREIAEQNAAPEDLTTGSWEALRLVEQAQDRMVAGDAHSALVFTEEASEADPGFATAQSLKGDILGQLRLYREAFAAHQQALALIKQRDVTGRERFEIEAKLNDETGDDEASIKTDRAWIAHYPKDFLPHFFLGDLDLEAGKYEQGLLQMQEAEKLSRRSYTIYPHLASHYLAVNQPDKAMECARRLRELREPEWATEVEGRVLFSKQQFAEALQKFETLAGSSDEFWSGYAPFYVAHIRADMGDTAGAEQVLRDAIHNDEQHGFESEAAARTVALAYLGWQSHDDDLVREAVMSCWTRLDDPEAVALAAGLLARIRDLRDAARVAGGLTNWPDMARVRRAKGEVALELALARRSTNAASIRASEDGAGFPVELQLYAARKERDRLRILALLEQIQSRLGLLLNAYGDSWKRTPGLYWVAFCSDAQQTSGTAGFRPACQSPKNP